MLKTQWLLMVVEEQLEPKLPLGLRVAAAVLQLLCTLIFIARRGTPVVSVTKRLFDLHKS